MQNGLFNLQKFIKIPVINTSYHNFQLKYQCSTESIHINLPLYSNELKSTILNLSKGRGGIQPKTD